MCESYSLPNRRKNSRVMTSSTTPIHDAAKAPADVTCHDSARKQASIVYQFHSICILVSIVHHRILKQTYRYFAGRPIAAHGTVIHLRPVFRRMFVEETENLHKEQRFCVMTVSEQCLGRWKRRDHRREIYVLDGTTADQHRAELWPWARGNVLKVTFHSPNIGSARRLFHDVCKPRRDPHAWTIHVLEMIHLACLGSTTSASKTCSCQGQKSEPLP